MFVEWINEWMAQQNTAVSKYVCCFRLVIGAQLLSSSLVIITMVITAAPWNWNGASPKFSWKNIWSCFRFLASVSFWQRINYWYHWLRQFFTKLMSISNEVKLETSIKIVKINQSLLRSVTHKDINNIPKITQVWQRKQLD